MTIGRIVLLIFVFSVPCWSQSTAVGNSKGKSRCVCLQEGNDSPQGSDYIALSPADLRSHVARIVPLPMPDYGNHLMLNGTIEVDLRFDSHGKVTCAQAISGNPFAMTSTMQVIRQWSFKPVLDARGKARGGCGRLLIAYRLSDTESSTSLQ
jgi:hypothetical protein